MVKKRVKKETTLPKIPKRGRLKGTELSERGGSKDITGASQACIPSDSQHGRDVENELLSSRLIATKTFVPVVDVNNKPLMPTTPSRARRWIKSGKGTGFWNHGVYCVRLNVTPSDSKFQDVCTGIDPGSKKEGYSVKSAAHTYLNINADAVTWVKENVETKRNLRRSRRQRTTPYRKCRFNRQRNEKRMPPSTKSRWQAKLRTFNWLRKMFPIADCIVENIAAKTMKNGRKWNVMFSPLEVGKQWFYEELRKITNLHTKKGHETCELRKSMGLTKSKNKKAEIFEAHCVDSWVLANSIVGGHTKPDNTKILTLKPLRFYRRQLHVQNPIKGEIRKQYGGTMSEGFKRGSLVIHPKYGLCFVGGTRKNMISLHEIEKGQRLCQNANPKDIKFVTYNSFLTRNPHQAKTEAFPKCKLA